MEAKVDRRAFVAGLVALASCYSISLFPRKKSLESRKSRLEELANAEKAASAYSKTIETKTGYEEFIKSDRGVLLVYDKLDIDIQGLGLFTELAKKHPNIRFGMIRTDSEAALPALQGTRYMAPAVQVYENGQRAVEGTLVRDSTHQSEVSAQALGSYLAGGTSH